MEIGKYHELTVLRETSVGLYLGNEADEDILLPNKFVMPEFKVDDVVKVFVYLDSDERPVATTQIPEIVLNDFAFLEVGYVTPVGAFMNWNIDKQLLVPFQEQKAKMQEGEFHLVHMHLDEKTNRLVGSAKWQKFISKNTGDLKDLDEVDIMVLGESPLGYNCIVNCQFMGLAYKNENFQEVGTGMHMKAYVKQVRSDGKLDLLFEKPGLAALEDHAEKILGILRKNGGFLAFHDKSDAKEVQENLQMSKKAFKRAIGNLYKNKLIELADDGIKLAATETE
ncbi:MAG: putative RNA-binding protein (virulence factor B family) [Chitinophagales bacterium]|jgi:predicted RNA-binding protein (virulence factor B family)